MEADTGNPDDSTTFGNAFAMGLEVCMYRIQYYSRARLGLKVHRTLFRIHRTLILLRTVL